MVEHTSNDNGPAPDPRLMRTMDPLGRAAVLLVESLIHGLIARRIIDVAEAVHMVEIAIDVIGEQALDAGDLGVGESTVVLERIRASLAIDLA